METYKVKESPEAIKEAWERIGVRLLNGGQLLIQVTHTSKTNMSYRYSVRLAYIDDDGRIDFQNLAYWIASVTGETVVSQYYGDELRGNGIGINRYFLAALEVGHILENLGLIADHRKIATRQMYEEI